MSEEDELDELDLPVVRAPADQRWLAKALCTSEHLDILYATDARRMSAARQLCAACDVQMECLDYALANGEQHGVWGGTTEKERRAVARSVHGTPERYRSRRCRCEACSDAVLRWRAAQVVIR